MVGVSDEGEPIGLEKDDFKSEDKMLLHWVNLLTNTLGVEFMPSVRSTLHTVKEQRVLVVECVPAKAPVFLRWDNTESFYVRMTNSTQSLQTSEVLAYIGQHFTGDPASAGGSGGGAPQARPDVPATADVDPGSASAPSEGLPGHASSSVGSGWFRELQQRRVIRTGVLYIVIAFTFTEIAVLVADTLEAPDWLGRALVLGFVAGFPLVLGLSWVYDLRVTKTDSRRVDVGREGDEAA